MTTIVRRLAAALSALVLLAACSGSPDGGARPDGAPPEAAVPPACPIVGEPATELALYFGRSIPGGGEVTEAEWTAFLDREVTPRFPDGLTAHEARGQWRSEASDPIAREASKVLSILVFDTAAARADIDALIEAYKSRFRQESVLLVARPVCARF